MSKQEYLHVEWIPPPPALEEVQEFLYLDIK